MKMFGQHLMSCAALSPHPLNAVPTHTGDATAPHTTPFPWNVMPSNAHYYTCLTCKALMTTIPHFDAPHTHFSMDSDDLLLFYRHSNRIIDMFLLIAEKGIAFFY